MFRVIPMTGDGIGIRVEIPDDTDPVRIPRASVNVASARGISLESASLDKAPLSGAEMPGVDLSSASLRGADLRYAQCPHARLSLANMTGADLSDANLCGADLRYAILRDANMHGAGLSGANLTDADLSGADMTRADLRRACLRDADMRGATLLHAALFGADLTGAQLPDFQLPQGVDLVGFKRVRGGICELVIPAAARRTASLVSGKCRAEYARVVSAPADLFWGSYALEAPVFYRAGEVVHPSGYDDDVRVECAPGIHFFQTLAEAERYVI